MGPGISGDDRGDDGLGKSTPGDAVGGVQRRSRRRQAWKIDTMRCSRGCTETIAQRTGLDNRRRVMRSGVKEDDRGDEKEGYAIDGIRAPFYSPSCLVSIVLLLQPEDSLLHISTTARCSYFPQFFLNQIVSKLGNHSMLLKPCARASMEDTLRHHGVDPYEKIT
ncbi:hypothetical protein BDD12DRAFT_891491 [Trichophaea hybrida]|nr:hypothetical protein BDD12DRAFT_891491 [Trichophaea hybrida]